jgi:hypothetical protein
VGSGTLKEGQGRASGEPQGVIHWQSNETSKNSPCYETPKNAMKNRAKKSEGEKNGGKNPHIFLMSLDEEKKCLGKMFFFRVFELPLLRNAQKRD